MDRLHTLASLLWYERPMQLQLQSLLPPSQLIVAADPRQLLLFRTLLNFRLFDRLEEPLIHAAGVFSGIQKS